MYNNVSPYFGRSNCDGISSAVIAALPEEKSLSIPVLFCPSETGDRFGTMAPYIFEQQCITGSAVASYVGCTGANTADSCSSGSATAPTVPANSTGTTSSRRAQTASCPASSA